MSPTEFDLRAALRDGEGDGPDVDGVLAGAQAARSQRRTRILSATAAVIIVAGAASGGAVLATHSGGNGGHQTSGYAAQSGVSHDRGPAQSSAAAGAVPAASGRKAPEAPVAGGTATCPATFPSSELPGGGSPGQFGSSGKLFAKPVATILVCTYTDVATGSTGGSTGGSAGGSIGGGTTGGGGSTTGGGLQPASNPVTTKPSRLVLKGDTAQSLASSLENAPSTPLRTECPDYIVADAPSIAIIAVSTDGTVLPTVTTTLGQAACHRVVSNGTAVRYDWTPPASLGSALSGSGGSVGSGTPSH